MMIELAAIIWFSAVFPLIECHFGPRWFHATLSSPRHKLGAAVADPGAAMALGGTPLSAFLLVQCALSGQAGYQLSPQVRHPRPAHRCAQYPYMCQQHDNITSNQRQR
eukprot:scaffold50075_cov43-Prasinocladus_malaysianus.AAC.1